MKRIVLNSLLMVSLVASPLARPGTLQAPTTSVPPVPVQVREYYHSGMDHYFMTASEEETAALDRGDFPGWTATGYQFTAYSSSPFAGGASRPVCRFYGRPEAHLDSHFYSASEDECAKVSETFSSSWLFESGNVFQIPIPDLSSGVCPIGLSPVYRLFNNRSDANHRYTNDDNVKRAMVARGYISEGYGPNGVVFCTPSLSESPAEPVVLILVTQVAPDTFDFSSVTAQGDPAAFVSSYTWDFGDGTSANGPTASHRFEQVGNYAVLLVTTNNKGEKKSATRMVTAVKAPPAPPSQPGTKVASDFDARKISPGVFRWFSFDTTAQLGVLQDSSSWNGTERFGWYAGVSANPVIDTNIKASGGGALRFDIPSKSPANAGGEFIAGFSADGSLEFGPNSEFYIQMRLRLNDALQNTTFWEEGSGQTAATGQKFFGVAWGGDTSANEIDKIVVSTHNEKRFMEMYANSGIFGSDSILAKFTGTLPNWTDYLIQTEKPGCSYSAQLAGDPAACVHTVANEWMTVQLGVQYFNRVSPGGEVWAGKTYDDRYVHARVRLWLAREGQPSQLLTDWGPTTNGYVPLQMGDSNGTLFKIGKLVILSYMTRKDPTQVHALGQMWVDELIMSTQRIPDPAPATSIPLWRKGKPVGALFPIPGTARLSDQVNDVKGAAAQYIIDAYNGLAASPSAFYSTLGGGHRDGWRNMAIKLDLAQDVPAWSILNQGSTAEDRLDQSDYYADGRPSSAHTYYQAHYVPQRNSIIHFGSGAIFSSSGVRSNKINGFNLEKNEWESFGTGTTPYPDLPRNLATDMACAVNPATGDAYMGQFMERGFAKWTQATNSIEIIPVTDSVSWGNASANSTIDVARNRWVTFTDAGSRPSLHWMDLTTYGLGDVAVTGSDTAGLPGGYGALVHDTDNDRYLYVGSGSRGWALYSIDPNSGAAVFLAQIPSVADSGLKNRMAFFPALGGVGIVPSYASNVWFYPTR